MAEESDVEMVDAGAAAPDDQEMSSQPSIESHLQINTNTKTKTENFSEDELDRAVVDEPDNAASV